MDRACGKDSRSGSLFSDVDLKQRVRPDHLLRTVQTLVNVTAHVDQNTAGRRSAIDGRTTRHPGYGVSRRIEEGFGWGKAFGLLNRVRMHGREHIDVALAFSAAACNLIRLPKLLAEPKVA